MFLRFFLVSKTVLILVHFEIYFLVTLCLPFEFVIQFILYTSCPADSGCCLGLFLSICRMVLYILYFQILFFLFFIV